MITDKESIKQAVEAFRSLSFEDVTTLKELNTRVQTHKGGWGVRRGGEKNADGAIEMPWVEKDPLIYELLDFMDSKGLLPLFDWLNWSEGSALFMSGESDKFDNIDVATSLKLIYVATRKDRFCEGTLVWAFESGGFVKLIDRLVKRAVK